MDTVTIRDLRNRGGEVIDRVEAGGHVTVTRDGRPVAELRPLRAKGLSAITLAELSVGPLVTDDEAERARRLAHVQQAEADFDPLPFDAAAARAFGRVASSLRRSGPKPATRASDALIAATAIGNGLPLYTCSPGDFNGIAGLLLRPRARPGSRLIDTVR